MNHYQQGGRCSEEQRSIIAYLRTPAAIRSRCDRVFSLAVADQLHHFRCDLSQLDAVASYVINVMRDHRPEPAQAERRVDDDVVFDRGISPGKVTRTGRLSVWRVAMGGLSGIDM